jgi:pimeloyl-ACP methyl ester carboxylesterase
MVWHVWGDGAPLVLLHGGYGSWVHWIRNVIPLSAQRRVIVADLPGLGESDTPSDIRDPNAIAAVVATGLSTLIPGEQRFDLVGFSFGSVIAGHVAAQLGARVARLTLVGASGLDLPRQAGLPLERFRRGLEPDSLAALARRNLEILMLADPAAVDPVAVYMQIENTLRARVKSRWISRGSALRDVLPRVRARLSGLWGALDSTAYPRLDAREDLLRGFDPGLDFRVVEGAGHWVMYEAAEEFNRNLLDILGPRDD